MLNLLLLTPNVLDFPSGTDSEIGWPTHRSKRNERQLLQLIKEKET